MVFLLEHIANIDIRFPSPPHTNPSVEAWCGADCRDTEQVPLKHEKGCAVRPDTISVYTLYNSCPEFVFETNDNDDLCPSQLQNNLHMPQ